MNNVRNNKKLIKTILTSVVLFPTVLLANGCYVSNKKFIHPETKKEVDCSSWGLGLIGAPIAFASTQSCSKDSLEKGYVEASALAETKDTPKEQASEPLPENAAKNEVANKGNKEAESVSEKLEYLKDLKQRGILDEGEYQERRKKVIDSKL